MDPIYVTGHRNPDTDSIVSAMAYAALQNALTNKLPITDDCSAVEALGMQVHLTGGSEENIKITTPLDLELAETILKRRRRQCALERATMSTN